MTVLDGDACQSVRIVGGEASLAVAGGADSFNTFISKCTERGCKWQAILLGIG